MEKTSKIQLIVSVAVLFAAVLISVIGFQDDVDDVGRQGADSRQDHLVTDGDLQDGRQQEEPVISDTELPPARMPVLRIGAREAAGIYLQSLDIQVEVTGNIASTRYTMVFRNSTGRDLEGELTFPLPDGRTATHYALDVDGKMRDAVPVEKVRATQVFEEIQQRVQAIDPGILERVEGNNFRTRIYPFPRFGTRTISVGYEEELSLENGLLYYRLPMAYPNALEKFGVTATVWDSGRKPLVPESAVDGFRFDKAGENYVATFTGHNFRPSRALVFALPAPADIPQVIMQSAQGSHYFLASVAPKEEKRKKQWSDELAIIWDVSLSGSQRNMEHEIKMLDVIFADKKNANVHLYFLNNRLKKVVDKNAVNGEYKVVDGDWEGLKKTLQRAIFDGGTDFSRINLNNIVGSEILFFSDGLSTLSDADFIRNTKVNRPVHCFVSSAQADYSAMKLIAGKTKGKFVNINALSYEKLKDELLNETLQFLGVEHGKSVREVYPSIAAPVQGNFSVAGISSGSNEKLTLLFGFGNKVERRIAVNLDASKAGRQGNVYRIWAQKKIEELDLDFDRNRAVLTELGTQFGIVTRNTSLIVLEFLDDYVLFNIEPPVSEPQLRAEYHRRRRGREADMRNAERGMMNEAVAAAASIRRWWNSEFKLPDEPKYPVPDGLGQAMRSGGGTNASGNAGSFGSGSQSRGSQSSGSQSRGSQSRNARAGVSSEFFESLPEERTARMVRHGESEEPRGSQTATAMQGGGDPRARVEQMGVLGVVSGQIKGRSVASADVFGSGGFSTDVDAVLSGVGGLKSGSEGGTGRTGGQAGIGYGSGFGSGFGESVGNGTGRKGEAGIGYGSGYGSGFGGSGGGIDDLLGGLMGGSGGLDLRRRGELRVTSPDFLSAGALTGARSRASIQRVVMQNTPSLRHAYSRRLREKPGLEGVITVRFAINEFGHVTTARMVSSSMNDPDLETTVVNRVRSWIFQQIDKPGDVTEVTYPFHFSNEGVGQSRRAGMERDANADRLAQMSQAERAEAERVRELVRKLAEQGYSAYMMSLTGNIADDYQEYLRLRTERLNSPQFYFEMSTWFYRHGDRETALRVLTSIAELEIENAMLYRLLGYRFKEYGEHTLQKFAFRKVKEWRPMEPQSYRDYALALADNGETQAALDSLNALLTKTYSASVSNRSRGIEEVVITEINNLIAKNPRLSNSKIDRRLRMNMPVDVRVVLNWNMNNTDVDLSVIDPTGEESIYRGPRDWAGSTGNATTIGGRLSANNSSGYGPEQFTLKKAAKGKYQVYASFRSAREFAAAGPITVMAEIYTNYGGKNEERQIVTMQLSKERARWEWDRWGNRTGSSGRVLMGEFEI